MSASPTLTASASGSQPLTNAVTEIRATDPDRIGRALARRPRADLAGAGRLMVVACDHPAHGALGAGKRPLAMADREDLLQHCMTALSRLGINRSLGTAEIIEDLTPLDVLDGKLAQGSMNRIGLQGASFEMGDRLDAYDTGGIETSHLDGGKMFTRINDADPASAAVLEASAKAIDSLPERGLNVMVEPLTPWWEDGRVANDLSEEATIRPIRITQALEHSSAHTWLKLPCAGDPAPMRCVMAPTSLPNLTLGDEVSTGPEVTRASWTAALEFPNVRGLAADRLLLYPDNDDAKATVDAAVALL